MLARFLTSLFLATALAGAQTQVCTTVSGGGSTCSPVLTVTFLPNGQHQFMQLNATNLHTQSIGAMIWGLNSVSIPVIPGSSCLLLTDYLWGHTFMSDSLGEWTYGRSWPSWYQSYFRIQVGTLVVDNNGIPDVRTSNCVVASCSLQ